jgi:D-3-phosphoglycerate dehydrogenase
MKIVIVGDRIVKNELLLEAVKGLSVSEGIEIKSFIWETEDRPDFQRRAQNLEKNGPEAEDPPAGLIEGVADADVLLVHFCPVPEKVIEAGKNLKLIGTCRGGMEHVDVDAATRRNIPVIHVIRNAEATSDFAIGLIFSETRNIARGHAAVKNGVWRKDYVNAGYTTTIREMTLGLVGLGNIGKLVAEKASALGMNVLAHDPYVPQEKADSFGLKVRMTEKEEIFRNCDVVSLHMRATPETKNSIGRDLLGMMKPTAYLINTSRATVIDKDALYDALKDKAIGGAALDVFWDEPVSMDDPMLSLDNLTMTPHLAGNVVDALPKSPNLLIRTINKYWNEGNTEMVVNADKLN